MIVLEIGNPRPIEGYWENGTRRFKEIEGNKVTILVFREDISFGDLVQEATTALSFHLRAGRPPAWMVSTSAPLLDYLNDYFLGPFGHAGQIPRHKPSEWGVFDPLPEEDESE